jgi:PAB-dependent poly(A)-specific ribonuclease subunit 3
VGSCGLVDVMMYDSRQDIAVLQQEDFSMLGWLVFALCSGNANAVNNLPKAMETLGRNYSAELKSLALFLTSKHGPMKVCFPFCLEKARCTRVYALG